MPCQGASRASRAPGMSGRRSFFLMHSTRLYGNNGIAMCRAVLHSGGHIPYRSVHCAARRLPRYCAVYGQVATLVLYCDKWFFAVYVRAITVWFGFGSLHTVRFRTDRYSVRRRGDTCTARYMACWRYRYRTVTSGTVQYASVLSQYDLDSVWHTRPDSVLVGTVCSKASTPVLHGTWPDSNTGIIL